MSKTKIAIITVAVIMVLIAIFPRQIGYAVGTAARVIVK